MYFSPEVFINNNNNSEREEARNGLQNTVEFLLGKKKSEGQLHSAKPFEWITELTDIKGSWDGVS